MIFLDLFMAKEPLIHNVKSCNAPADFKIDVDAMQNLVTSFESNDSVDYDYPKLNDIFMDSPILSKGILHRKSYHIIFYYINECSFRIQTQPS